MTSCPTLYGFIKTATTQSVHGHRKVGHRGNARHTICYNGRIRACDVNVMGPLRDSPWQQRSGWPGAVPPLSGPASEPGDESTCICRECSGPWCNPCKQWPSSRCHPPWRLPSGGHSDSHSPPVCSFLAGILDTPGSPSFPTLNLVTMTQYFL